MIAIFFAHCQHVRMDDVPAILPSPKTQSKTSHSFPVEGANHNIASFFDGDQQSRRANVKVRQYPNFALDLLHLLDFSEGLHVAYHDGRFACHVRISQRESWG